jgi:HTH-type transcriptional regulator/antitoxin HipB
MFAIARIDHGQRLRLVANAYILGLYEFAYKPVYMGLRILTIYTCLRIFRSRFKMNQQIARTEKQLGAILRRARKKAGLTQSGLGKNIHLRQGTVSRLEAGEPAIQLRTVMEALAALDLELVVRARSKAGPADIENIF